MSGDSQLPRWWLATLGVPLLWIYTYGMASNPLKWEEPRRCLVAMEMIHSGDYVVPHVLGETYLKKPPLQNWLLVFAAGNDARRVGPVAIRSVSLLALLAAAVLLWRLGTSAGGGPSPLPVLVFLTMGVVLQSGRSGEVDALFTGLVVGASACFEIGRRRSSPWLQWFVPQLFVAAGVLTKVVAPLFFYPPVLFLAWTRRREIRLAPVAFVAGLCGAAALVAAWLVPYSLASPAGALADRWAGEVVTRTLDKGWAEGLRHVALYPLLLVAWMLPWSIHLVAPRRHFWRSLREAVPRDPWLALCTASTVWGAVVFLFVPEQKGRYLLPIVPFLSVLIAYSVERQTEGASRATRSRWLWALPVPVWVGLLVAFRVQEPWPASIVPPLIVGLLVLASFAYVGASRTAFAPPLLLLGLIYGVAYAGFAEPREAERGRVYVDAAREIADAIPEERPIVCHKEVSLKFAYALSHLLDRPLAREAGGAGSTYWVAGAGKQRANLGRPLAETGRYNLWQVDEPETWSMLGEPRFPPALPRETRAERIRRLAEARAAYLRGPNEPDSFIWLGRWMAYLGHYRKSIAIFDEGIRRFADDPRLYRHRGHRQITLRHFDLAIADLVHAAGLIRGRPDEVEPDGLPNARGVPTSTLQTNIWYHLGLAYYLTGDLSAAERSYREGLKVSKNPDMLCAMSHWLYMTLCRSGQDAEARKVLEPIHADMDIIENTAYHRLLLMYKGELDAEELLRDAGEAGGIELATIGYGVGNWHLVNGRRQQATEIFRRIVAGDEWAAFGHIAAEADLARIMDRAL